MTNRISFSILKFMMIKLVFKIISVSLCLNFKQNPLFNRLLAHVHAQLCLTLCDPMDCSTPGFPVHHLPELAQTHVRWVGDAIQPSHPLLSPSCMSLIRSTVDGSITLGIVLQYDGVGVMAGLGRGGAEMAKRSPCGCWWWSWWWAFNFYTVQGGQRW